MKNRFLTLLTVTMLAGSILVGCGGNGGVTAAFVSTGGLSLVWFTLRLRKV